MESSLYVLLAVIMGATYSIYLPMNSSVSRYLGSPITANLSFYSVALVTSLLIFALFGDGKTLYRFKEVPPYLLLTGMVSAFIVLGVTFLIPKLGPRRLFILSIASQITCAMIVSHFGVLESPTDPITAKKILGAALLFLGAAVSTV